MRGVWEHGCFLLESFSEAILSVCVAKGPPKTSRVQSKVGQGQGSKRPRQRGSKCIDQTDAVPQIGEDLLWRDQC